MGWTPPKGDEAAAWTPPASDLATEAAPATKETATRVAGLTAGNLLDGINQLADTPNGINHLVALLGTKGYNLVHGANTQVPTDLPNDSLVPGLVNAPSSQVLGLPQAQTPGEQLYGAGMRGAAGALVNPEAPFASAMAGATGGAASELAAQNGASPGWQLAAGLAGGLAPGLTGAALKRATQFALEIDPKVAATNIDNATAAGTNATVGLAAGPGTRAQTVESYLSKAPGGAGIMRAMIDKRNAQAAQQVQDIAANLGAGASTPESAGTVLQSGLKDSWLPGQRDVVKAAYDARDAAVPQGTMVNVDKTIAAIEKQKAESPTFRAFAAADPEFQAFEAAVEKAKTGGADTITLGNQRGRLVPDPKDPSGHIFVPDNGAPATSNISIPYQDAAIAQRGFNNHVDYSFLGGNTTASINGNLSQVAKAASGDVKSALAGTPAAAAQSKADALLGAFESDKAQLKSVMSALTPEDAFNKLMDKAQNGATILSTAMRGLKPADQNIMAGSVIREMGLATPGAQNARGTAWSAERFLTNWNQMPETSRNVLFKNLPPETKDQLDKFAAYAENVKKSASVYSNPSGTAPASALLGAGAAAGLAAKAAFTGHPLVAAAYISPLVIHAAGAGLMTNPGVVRWLAASTKLPPSALPVIATQLAQYGAKTNNPDVTAFAQQVSALRP